VKTPWKVQNIDAVAHTLMKHVNMRLIAPSLIIAEAKILV